MKRSKPLHGDGALALTPAGAYTPSGDRNLKCQRCQDKENYIAQLKGQVERLQKVIRDKDDFILSKQNFIEKVKAVFRGEQETLRPSPTRRPAQKGHGI
jgi:hypothetical protein